MVDIELVLGLAAAAGSPFLIHYSQSPSAELDINRNKSSRFDIKESAFRIDTPGVYKEIRDRHGG